MTGQHCHPNLACKPPPLTRCTDTTTTALTLLPPQLPPLNCGTPPIQPLQLPLSLPPPQPCHSTTTLAHHTQALKWCYSNTTCKAPPPPACCDASTTWHASTATLSPQHSMQAPPCPTTP